jgi:hypothetical protein
MTLLHFALRAEAQSFLDFFRFTSSQNDVNAPFKLFGNDDIVIVISGIGAQKTTEALHFTLQRHSIDAVYNIGIVGCDDTSVPIGTLFSYLPYAPQSAKPPVVSVSAPQTKKTRRETTLYDMELEAFYSTLQEKIDPKRLGAFKIVSDHLKADIPSKAYVKALVGDHRDTILKAIENA